MIPFATVRALAGQFRFALFGVAAALPTIRGDFFRLWLEGGRNGEMAYLSAHLEQRLDPRVLLEGARSIICVADRHATTMAPCDTPDATPDTGQSTGRIARYAWGDDYHLVLKKRLFGVADALRQKYPRHQFKVAVDTAPILEREHAGRAGLGWIGKHTLLIHPQIGSYMLLGQIVTTLPIETSSAAGHPAPTRLQTDHCGTCTRCIDACPTDCIRPYQLDASRCISYLTIEHRSLIDPELHGQMGDWIAGCDVCQEVCPFNGQEPEENQKSADDAVHPHYTPRPPAPALGFLEVLDWSAEDRSRAFVRSALKRIKLDMLKRNVLIAAGNHLRYCEDPELRRKIESLAGDEGQPTLVRETARAVLRRLTRCDTAVGRRRAGRSPISASRPDLRDGASPGDKDRGAAPSAG